ncbi:MAG TPA: hypothetical protein VHS29_12500, partial [Candidatus Acidoferrales bacterium]|nr:hypothetical protein [Candidatus Acidoferrales bacterium]
MMKSDCNIPSLRFGWKQLLPCLLAITITFAITLLAQPLSAQQQQNSKYSPRFGMGHLPDATVVHNPTVDSSAVADDAKCFPWKLSEVRAGTVDVQNLNIPSNAKHEFEKACDASKKSKYEEVEQHARSAIEKFEKYPAAWVMLGLSLEE